MSQVGSGVWADPMWSIDREPREEDHTTWTAVAPDAVFTVLTGWAFNALFMRPPGDG